MKGKNTQQKDTKEKVILFLNTKIEENKIFSLFDENIKALLFNVWNIKATDNNSFKCIFCESDDTARLHNHRIKCSNCNGEYNIKDVINAVIYIKETRKLSEKEMNDTLETMYLNNINKRRD